MPKPTPIVKVQQTEGHDANVILHGDKLEEAADHAHALAEQRGLTFVHPFDDPHVMAGQGTIALEMLEDAPERTLIGLEGLGRKPVRAGYTVHVGDRTVGEVTSGLPSPTLGKPVAMALVATDALERIDAGEVSVQDARGRAVEVTRTALPFYKRS